MAWVSFGDKERVLKISTSLGLPEVNYGPVGRPGRRLPYIDRRPHSGLSMGSSPGLPGARIPIPHSLLN